MHCTSNFQLMVDDGGAQCVLRQHAEQQHTNNNNKKCFLFGHLSRGMIISMVRLCEFPSPMIPFHIDEGQLKKIR